MKLRDLIAALLGAALTFGAGQTVQKTPIETVKDAQSAYIAETGTYFSVTEYLTPSGERGYQIFYEDDQNQYSTGIGPEAEDRSFELSKTVASST